MNTFNIPPGVEVVVGYKDGSLRTYQRDQSIFIEDGMQLMGVRTAPTVTTPPPVAPLPILSIILHVGIALWLYAHGGAISLIAYALVALWLRSIYGKAAGLRDKPKRTP